MVGSYVLESSDLHPMIYSFYFALFQEKQRNMNPKEAEQHLKRLIGLLSEEKYFKMRATVMHLLANYGDKEAKLELSDLLHGNQWDRDLNGNFLPTWVS